MTALLVQTALPMSQPILFVLLSTTLYTLINMAVKVIDLSVFQIVFFRALISLSLCFWLLKRKNIPFFGHNKKWLMARGLFGTLALLLIWWTMQNIPFAIATILFNTTPILAVLIAHFFSSEKATNSQWALLSIAFIGVLLARGLNGEISFFWMLVGLTGAFCAALAYTFIRKIKESEDALVIIMYFPLITLPVVSPLALWTWQWPSPMEWTLLIAIGFITQVAQFFMTRAFQLQPAGEVMIFNYFGLLLSVFIGHFAFKELLSGIQYLGLALTP